jgi:hypothetical protein
MALDEELDLFTVFPQKYPATYANPRTIGDHYRRCIIFKGGIPLLHLIILGGGGGVGGGASSVENRVNVVKAVC